MRVWLENGTHIIIEGEDNFKNAGFVDTQKRAIPARWKELVTTQDIENLQSQRDEGAERYKVLFSEFTALRAKALELERQRDELRDKLSTAIDRQGFTNAELIACRSVISKCKEATK